MNPDETDAKLDWENKALVGRLMLESVKRSFPEEWKLVCGRRFRNVERFYDYKTSLGNLANSIGQWDIEARQDLSDRVGKAQAAIASRHSFPVFFVYRQLLDACLESRTLPVIDWKNINLPYESMSFVFPLDAITFAGMPVVGMSFTRIRAGEYIWPGKLTKISFDKDLLVISAIRQDSLPITRTLDVPFVVEEKSAWKDVWDTHLRNTDDPDEGWDGEDEEESEFSKYIEAENTRVIDDVAVLAFNLLFAMAARPQYVEPGGRISTHKKSGEEVWTPNTVGLKYAVKRNPNAEHGTHASPRMHWRRGHFRQQVYGANLSQAKIIWIEPVLVNAKE